MKMGFYYQDLENIYMSKLAPHPLQRSRAAVKRFNQILNVVIEMFEFSWCFFALTRFFHFVTLGLLSDLIFHCPLSP